MRTWLEEWAIKSAASVVRSELLVFWLVEVEPGSRWLKLWGCSCECSVVRSLKCSMAKCLVSGRGADYNVKWDWGLGFDFGSLDCGIVCGCWIVIGVEEEVSVCGRLGADLMSSRDGVVRNWSKLLRVQMKLGFWVKAFWAWGADFWSYVAAGCSSEFSPLATEDLLRMWTSISGFLVDVEWGLNWLDYVLTARTSLGT